MKKNMFKILAEAFAFNGLKNVAMPMGSINRRKLTIDEMKEFMKEEFGKGKKACDVKAKEKARGWGDAELEKEIEWIKTLDLKEFFSKRKSK